MATGALVCALAGLATNCKLADLVNAARAAHIGVTPVSLLDSARVGSTAPRVISVALDAGATEAVPWTAHLVMGGTWLKPTAMTGTAPGNLSIALDPAGLAVGDYQDTIVFALVAPGAVPDSIPVLFHITGCNVTAASVGATVTGGLAASDCAAPHHAGTPAQLFGFNAAAGDSISIKLSSSAFDAYVVLDSSALGSSAPALAANDACHTGLSDACLRYLRLPRTGAYIVEATSAAGGASGPFALTISKPRPPLLPDTLVQLASDLVTPVATGGTLTQSAVNLRASLADSDLDDTLRLDVEVQPIGVAFTNTPTGSSALVAGGRAVVAVAGLANDTAYHWQARTVDQTGRSSAWTSFGGNAESAADFRIAVPQPPALPASLGQTKTGGATLVTGATTDEGSVLLQGLVDDPDPGDQVRLEVEVRPLGTPFTNAATASSPPVARGAVASVAVSGLADNVGYHWQARAVDQTTQASAWTPFGSNAETAADFSVAIAPARLAVTVQPSAVVAGAVIAPAVKIAAQDAGGATLASFGGTISIALGTNPAGGTLSGTATAAAVAGVATFSNLRVDRAASGYTLVATAGSLTATSSAFTVAPGPASRFTFTASPTGATAGVAFTPSVQVTALDSVGNTATGFSSGVTVSIGANPGGGTLSGIATVTASSGVASFGPLSIDRAGTGYTLVASAASVAAATSPAFAVGTGAADHLTITAQPATSAASGATFAQQPVIQLRDAVGNAVAQAGVVVTAAIATGGGTLGGTLTATTTGGGVASFTDLRITGAVGDRTLAFSAPALTGIASGTVTITPGAADHLTITTQPSATESSGSAFAQQPLLQLRDASGNAVGQAGVVVTAAIATGGGTLGGTLTATTNAAGVAAFTNLSITGAAGDRTLNFSATSLTGIASATITVSAGGADHLTITTQPSAAAQSGVAFPQQPVIQLRDGSGNAVGQAGVVVTAAIATGGGTLGGTLTATTNASGVASFTNLAITGTTGDRTLSFGATGLTGITSATITVGAGAAHHLTITTQPSAAAQSGVAFPQQPVIQLRDASGNAVGQAGVVVTAAIATGGGTLGGAQTATTNASGAATFTNLSITGTAGDRTLGFGATGLTGITSATITVGAGAAHHLTITTQPSAAAQSGVAFLQQPVLQLRDTTGNAVSQAGVVVTAAIASGGGALGGTLSATTNASGVATFTNLSVTGTAGDRTLNFSATGLTGITSATITLGAGTADHLTITTQPSTAAQSGSVLAQQPVLQLRDASGNAVAQAGVVVTAAIATGGGTLGGTLTATTGASGVATFTNLSITGTVGDRTLSFGATGLTGITSGTITLSASSADHLTITTQPSATAQSGVALAQQPVIQVLDASNNPVSQAGVLVTATFGSGTGTLANASATTNGSGVATFVGLSISGLTGARTLTFGATALTGATSGAVTLSAGPAAQLTITTQPSTTSQSGAAFPQQPVLQLRDNAGNVVSQAGVVVTAAIAAGGGTLGGTLTATTSASGVATFSGLRITGTIGDRTLSFSATNVTAATSGTITITAGAADHLAITTQPSTTAPSGGVFAQQPVIQLQDASNNAVSQASVVVTAAIATGGGTLATTLTATTNASGVASFTNLKITGTAGDRTISFTATSLTAATSGTVTITAGAADHLAITTQPSATAQSGVAFLQQPVIQLRDASGNAVSQAGTIVTAAIATGAVALGGTLTATTNASGVATFTDLAITGTVGDRTLSFSATSLTAATSGTITITAGAANLLTITTQPSTTAQSGAVFGQQPVIQLRDASGNAVSQAGTVVTAAIATGGAALGGTLTATTNASGVATFTDLKITGTVSDRTLTFTAASLTSATSGTITITAGAADHLAITTQPSTSAQSGAVFAQQPVIQLQDASGNVVSQAGVVVTAAIATGAGTLGGTLTATTSAGGVATFADLKITGTVGDRTLTFTATSLTSATSGTVTISAGAADHLAITTQPSTAAQSDVVFAQQPVIQLQDASGNTVSQAGTVVTAAIATGGGTLGGTLTATTTAGGVATFTDLKITGTVGDRTLTFTATPLTSATSGTVTITAGAADHLTITTPPSSNAQSGSAFAQQPVIQLRDASGNAATQSGVIVTAAIATGGGTLGGAVTATTSASGIATFTNLSISGTVGDRTLSFSATSLTSVTSGTITISASSADHLTITTQPSTSAQSGVAFGQQPVIQLRDASSNAVSQSGVVVIASIASGGGTLGTSQTATTDANGVATFAGLSISGLVGDRTLTFSAGALTGVTSGTVTITAGPAAQLTITTQPSTTSQSGVVFLQQPVLQLRDGAGNAVTQAGVDVIVALASGGGTLGGTSPATTNASGVATFTDLKVTGVVGDRTLLFSASALTSATSGTITVTAGAATQLTITTQPSTTSPSGAVFTQQPVLQLRDASGNAVSQANVVVTAAIATGGAALGGTLTATTNASGVATFTDLVITGTVGDRTLAFSATSLTGATSGTITISAGATSQLTITTQPSTTSPSGAVFTQQPVLQLRDASGNAVSQANVVVTAAIATGAGTLGGTLTASTNAGGVATFTDLEITGTIGDRTLSFSATSLTGATSGTITITGGAATQLTITTQPSTTSPSGAVFTQQPVLQLRDASGNAVSQTGVVVTAAIASGGAALGGTLTATTNASGVATFTDLVITGTVGDRTLAFSATSLTGATSGTITITAGAATQLTITTQPSTTSQSGVAFAQQPVLQLRDAAGNAVSQAGVVVTAALASGGAALGGTLTATTSASGVATFTDLAITGIVGDRTLGFSATALTGATSGTITITAGAASQLTITTQASTTAQSGVAFAQQPALQLRDASGNVVSQAGVVVTAAIASGGAALGGTLTATTNASGVATFTDLVITGTVGDRTLSFSATSLTGATSGTITIAAGAATQLAITTQPSTTSQSGAAFAPQPVLQLRDAAGNTVSQAGVDVTAAIASGAGTLGGTLTVATNTSGVATFTDLAITGIVGDRTLSFSATSLTGATSGTITITAGTAATLQVTTQPLNVNAGQGLTLVITAHDASGNTATGFSGAVSLAVASGPGGLFGYAPIAAVNGVATFTGTGLNIHTAGTYQVTASATALTDATTNNFVISAAGVNHLAYTTAPATTSAGAAFTVALELRDVFDNLKTNFDDFVTLSIAGGTGTGGAHLAGVVKRLTVSGVVSFTGLAIDSVGTGYRLNADFGFGVPTATSGAFDITAGAASHLTITTQPSTTSQSGVAFAQQPALQLRDASGNAVSQASIVVTAAIASGGGTLGGTLSASTNASGLATFADLAISGTVGDRTLSFSATALTGATSGAITITAGAATQIVINSGDGQSATVGTAVTTPPSVIVKDALNNPVAGVSVTFAVATGGGTVSPTTPILTDVNGIAQVTSWTLGTTAGANTVTATSTGLSGSPVTFTATGTAGAATQIQFTTQPSDAAAASNITPAVQATVQDGFGNTVTNYVGNVTIAIHDDPNTGASVLSGTLTQPVSNGVATFADLQIDLTGVGFTLSATAGLLTMISLGFTIS